MENGDSSESSDASLWQSLRIPPFRDCDFPSSASAFSCQYPDVAHRFNTEVAQKLAARGVIKAVEEVSHLLCKYHFLLLRLGTTQDGESLRVELAKMQQSSCDIVTAVRMQLSSAFKRTDSLPKKDIVSLEKSCRILVACIHMLDRQLRRTLHLYRLFPLIPDPDGLKECYFINTGVSESNSKNPSPLLCRTYDIAERYIREKDSWQELEKEILEVHNLDVDLHRDEVLGPILDYLTLCPMVTGLDNISSSTVSVSDMCIAPETCTDDIISRKKSSLACYIIAIAAVVCVGGGVLLGVIFMIVY